MSLVRDLGFISWKDELASFDDMRTAEFRRGAAEQNGIYNSAPVSKQLKKIWTILYKGLPHTYPPYYSFRWAGHTISVSQQNRYIPVVCIEVMDGKKYNFGGVVAYGIFEQKFWCIQDLSNGREMLTFNLYSHIMKKLTTIENVGDSAAYANNYVYYTNAEDIFWFNKIYRLDEAGNRELIYEEKEQRYILTILKPKGQEDIFVLRRSALNQDVGIIEDDDIRWLAKGFGRKIPINRKCIAFNSFFSNGRDKIQYPAGNFLVDVYSRGETRIFIFTKDATQSLYTYYRRWVPIIPSQVCELKFSEYSEDIIMGVPNGPDRVINLNKFFVPILAKELTGPQFGLESGASPLPWFAVIPKEKPKGIVICGYGSYGMSMRKHQQRIWIPWLLRGFIIANVCVRGGGENGDYWWDSSRTAQKRHYGIRDFVVGVNLLQSRYNMYEKNTIIYGRSAGGFLVTAAMYELMDKVAIVYAAKPYTDVLRTTTDPKARQAVQESEEFGLVKNSNNVTDFIALAKVSPYENVPANPIVSPVVILTGGTNDSEVPASMPLRFAKRLQQNGWKNVYCRIQAGEGHFTDRDKEYAEANDGALCESIIKQINEFGQFDEVSKTSY